MNDRTKSDRIKASKSCFGEGTEASVSRVGKPGVPSPWDTRWDAGILVDKEKTLWCPSFPREVIYKRNQSDHRSKTVIDEEESKLSKNGEE